MFSPVGAALGRLLARRGGCPPATHNRTPRLVNALFREEVTARDVALGRKRARVACAIRVPVHVGDTLAARGAPTLSSDGQRGGEVVLIAVARLLGQLSRSRRSRTRHVVLVVLKALGFEVA
eukprot:CAMPEP_0198680228 /NCGR_PEP_ID=MMETSP1468-20131203/4306_1 /TAXON_ID=1461545 /ORGANISM="Mantoniella sp, Strain CCMP1436" /LENGTH=121 /DNA_ID=CAMNT_0044420103 /DNA_START=410 /DNA_END=775 /DNA_ORIENTATION=+